jgi:hypothetical protein
VKLETRTEQAAGSFGATVAVSLAVFTFLLAAFAASPMTTSTDSRWSVHSAMSFAKGHGGDLTEYLPIIEKEKFYSIEYPDGRPRTRYPIGTALLAAPAVAVIAWLRPEWAERLPNEIPVGSEQFIASIIGAAAGVVFFWVILSEFQSLAIALASTGILSFCTSIWSTATRALWQHGPLVLMLVIAMLLLVRARRRPELIQYVALPLAMAYLIRPTALVPITVLSTYVLLFRRVWFVRYLCWAMVIALPWIAYNFTIYGRPFPVYYNREAFSAQTRFVEGLLGNLFSPSRGLFVFSPVLLFAPSGFVLALRDRAQRPLNIAYGAIIVGNSIIIGAANSWWAGHAFGPRVFHGLQFSIAGSDPTSYADGCFDHPRNACAGQPDNSRAGRVPVRDVGMELHSERYRPKHLPRLGLARSTIRADRAPLRTLGSSPTHSGAVCDPCSPMS